MSENLQGEETSEARRARWIAEATALEARLAAPGVASREQVMGLSGIEFFKSVSAGDLPSVYIGRLLGFLPIEFSVGRAVFQGTPAREHYNPLGSIHGGYAATLLDSCLGCAVHSTLPAGRGYTTLELKINYIRGMSDKTGPVRAEGQVVHVGSQVGLAEGRLIDSAGKLIAFGTTTCLIFAL